MLGPNLKYLRLKMGLSQDAVAKYLGKKSFTTIQKWESGVSEPSVKDTQKLCSLFNVNIDDLVNKNIGDNANSSAIYSEYPYFDTAISAGALEAVDAIDSAVRIEVPDAIMGRYAHHKDIVFLKVNGESMNRVIPNGSIIAVQTAIEKESLSNGDIVVAYTAEGYSVKRLFLDRVNHRAILRPDSTDISFSDIVVDCSSYEELHIFGRVVIYSVVL